MNNSLMNDRINLIDSDNPPKSFFTLEKMHRINFTPNDCPYHYHDWYELYYIIEGNIMYRTKHNNYFIEQGGWIFIPPKVKHKTIYSSSDSTRYLFYFSKDYINPSLYQKLDQLIAHTAFAPSSSISSYLDDIVNRVYNEFQNPSDLSDEFYKCYLFEILATLLKDAEEKPTQDNNNHFLVENTITYINKHFNEKINLQALADINYVTPNYLSRLFKQITGINLFEYIQTIRFNHAKKLLTETNEPISQVAEKCGFGDANYFSYTFKKSESVSPLQYRKLRSHKTEVTS